MTRAMSYDELAAAFGIERDSARKMVRRKRWSRYKANDGTMRIQVPEESLPRPGDSPADSPGGNPRGSPAPESHAVLSLSRTIERLEAELAELRVKAAERDVLAGQVEALKAVVERLLVLTAPPLRRWWWGRLLNYL